MGDHLLARAHRAAGDLHPPAVDEDAAQVDQHPRAPAGQPGHARGQHLIQAEPGLLGRTVKLTVTPLGSAPA